MKEWLRDRLALPAHKCMYKTTPAHMGPRAHLLSALFRRNGHVYIQTMLPSLWALSASYEITWVTKISVTVKRNRFIIIHPSSGGWKIAEVVKLLDFQVVFFFYFVKN